MAERAKIVVAGATQSVRLPRSCRFPEGHREVYARRVGKKIVLEPADEWSPEFVAALGGWGEGDERDRVS
jgi:virulence-associated protein VagC